MFARQLVKPVWALLAIFLALTLYFSTQTSDIELDDNDFRQNLAYQLDALIREADTSGDSGFSTALSALKAENYTSAITTLEAAVSKDPNWADAATIKMQYLLAYLRIMETHDYDRAINGLLVLQAHQAAQTQLDATEYLLAIAYEQTGQLDHAKTLLQAIKARHASRFSDQLPALAATSPLWFERASARIEAVEQRQAERALFDIVKRTNDERYPFETYLSLGQQTHRLLLTPNDLLANTEFYSTGSLITPDDPVTTFQGKIDIIPGSWVRLTTQSGQAMGVLFDGRDYIALNTLTGIGTLNSYWRDESQLQNDVVADVPTMQIDSLQSPSSASRNDYELANIGIVVDGQYEAYHHGYGMLAAISSINVSDALFRIQNRIALQLDAVVLDTELDDRYGSDNIQNILRNAVDGRRALNQYLPDHLAHVQWFVERPISHQSVGLAYVGGACRTDGFDVSTVLPYMEPGLLSAHEIAHNFGALHDQETNCSVANRQIMTAQFGYGMQYQFSNCSTETLNTTPALSCTSTGVDYAVDITEIKSSVATIAVTAQSGVATEFELQVNHPGSALAALPDRCRAEAEDLTICDGYGDSEFQIALIASGNTLSLDAVVSPIHYADFGVENDRHAVEIDASEDYVIAVRSDELETVEKTRKSQTGTSQNVASAASTPSSPSSGGGGSMGWFGLVVMAGALIVRRKRSAQCLATAKNP
ncbi:MAG: GlyGly-CTERM sorting domain-containing protein [Gammaproteobacteria bacterium]|nr:GlyGly-CTERM sorting domain-containing protein [Gammaproteobacteria bacterium]